MSVQSERLTLRDLPFPAKLVVTTFLLSVGLGYLWAMAQIHFKHASPGEPMPTLADIVGRFSGVPWPLTPKPAVTGETEKKSDDSAKADAIGVQVPAVKVKAVLVKRCVWCHSKDGEKDDVLLDSHDKLDAFMKKTPDHPKGQLHTVLTGSSKNWNKKSMVRAFTDKSEGWSDMPVDQRKAAEPKREAERKALVAWVEAGALKSHYDADRFPLPADISINDLSEEFRTTAPPLSPAAVNSDKKPDDPWKEAKRRQISVEALTQSTHAHLLSFSMLWALTGIVFAFSNNSYFLRCLISPIVLIARVGDISCWWLARLDGVGPYFALAILGSGAVVGLGLGAQITLSLWSMYSAKGRAMLLLLAVVGACMFGLAYTKVIKPQLEEEKKVLAQPNG